MISSGYTAARYIGNVPIPKAEVSAKEIIPMRKADIKSRDSAIRKSIEILFVKVLFRTHFMNA
ncbi:MAG: hypothetical protein RR287_05940, partial [Oscillospiraceae bacterium]